MKGVSYPRLDFLLGIVPKLLWTVSLKGNRCLDISYVIPYRLNSLVFSGFLLNDSCHRSFCRLDSFLLVGSGLSISTCFVSICSRSLFLSFLLTSLRDLSAIFSLCMREILVISSRLWCTLWHCRTKIVSCRYELSTLSSRLPIPITHSFSREGFEVKSHKGDWEVAL